ncbi:hypothetical protein [Enterococcus sp. BWR-S5]|uniref:hypothetical protein n=1 Tax=Enterococcus sp. BWR-S5 TaxID=2787714 RepID=UPI00192180E1|nr:hypothetical protein [Enterococcus sp. BWR-S5]MBL1224032.1 hypothetical protein [Enterococcus sp. BWR-S5]
MRKYITLLFCLSAFVLLTACSKQKSTADVELPEEDAAFVWWGERTRNFGQSEYTISEDEIKEVVEEKYGQKLLPLFEAANGVIDEEFSQDDLTMEEKIAVVAFERTFRLTRSAFFANKEGENLVSMKSTIEYEYYQDSGKSKLASQATEIRTATGDGAYLGKDLEAFIKHLMALMDISASEKSVKSFEKKNGEDEKSLAGQSVSVYDSRPTGKEEQTFGKYLIVQYDDKGIPQNIFLGTEDYRY